MSEREPREQQGPTDRIPSVGEEVDAGESAETSGDASAEAQGDDSAQVAESDSSGSEPSNGEPKLNRRARRAKEAGHTDPTDPSAVKDRNKKLRARAQGARAREREEAAAEGLDTRERVDDALAKASAGASRFIKNQFRWLQWVIVLGIVAWIGSLVVSYRKSRAFAKEGDRLGGALLVMHGKVASAVEGEESYFKDVRPEFATAEARAEAAGKSLSDLANLENPELSAWVLLAKGAALMDQAKWDDALKLYQGLAGRTEAPVSVRARATESQGVLFEAKGDRKQARAAYEKLLSFSLGDVKLLGKIHLSRLDLLDGNKDKARNDLTALLPDLKKEDDPVLGKTYLLAAIEDLLKTIDPKPEAPSGGGISPEQLEQLKKQIEAMQKAAGGPAGGPMEGLEIPMPAPPSEPNEAREPQTPPPAPAEKAPAPPRPVAPAPALAPVKAPVPAPASPAPAAPGSEGQAG